VTGDALEDEAATAADLSSKGYRQVGEISFDSFNLQAANISTPRKVRITVYLCLDVSATDTVDASGSSVVPEGRESRVGLEVDFIDPEGDLKISRSDVWTGTSFC
jgi:hypothetical protein